MGTPKKAVAKAGPSAASQPAPTGPAVAAPPATEGPAAAAPCNQLPRGLRVRVRGLTGAPENNGLEARIAGIVPTRLLVVDHFSVSMKKISK